MAEFDTMTGASGAATGAMLGATLAGPTLGMSVAVGALLGATGGLGLGFLGGGKRAPQIDITAAMAKIDALFEAQKQAAIKDIQLATQRNRRTSASNLASRGVLRSGVSENVFGELRRNEIESIASVSGKIAGQQAHTQASLLGQVAGANQKAQMFNQQQKGTDLAALISMGGSVATSLAGSGAFFNKAPSANGLVGGGGKLNTVDYRTGPPVARFGFGGSSGVPSNNLFSTGVDPLYKAFNPMTFQKIKSQGFGGTP